MRSSAVVVRSLTCVALAGCDSIFGLHTTQAQVIDARFFDAPLDAPFACPPLGTAPTFTNLFHQVLEQDCFGYTTTSQQVDLATALCKVPGVVAAQLTVEQGAIGSAVTPAMFGSAMSPSNGPVIGPDGDVMLAQDDSGLTKSITIALYSRVNGVWTFVEDVLSVTSTAGAPSTPTRGASARRFLLYPSLGSGGAFDEIVETSPGVWTNTVTHTTTELGVDAFGKANLSPDGLRIVFMGVLQGTTDFTLLYADRPGVGDPFGKAVSLGSFGQGVNNPFMTEDCGRLYFDGLGTVFYLEQ